MKSATTEVYPRYRVGEVVSQSVAAHGYIMTKLTEQEIWDEKGNKFSQSSVAHQQNVSRTQVNSLNHAYIPLK